MQDLKSLLSKKQEEDPQKLNQTPNLLDQTLGNKVPPTQRIGRALPIIVSLIVVLNVIELIIISWHVAQNIHLTSLKNMSAIAYQRFETKEKNWGEIDNVVGKISTYKEVSLQNENVTGYIKTIISGLPSETYLLDLTYENKEVTLEFEAQSVLAFTKMINNYFKEGGVEKIELKAASLNTEREIFAMEVRVTFK